MAPITEGMTADGFDTWRRSIRERFDSKWTPEPNTGCWLWTGGVEKTGYGIFQSPLTRGKKAHRHSWEFHRGPIPEGMHIDHICRVRSCVNPDHLRVVTPRENVTENSLNQVALNTQKTHCPQGHPYTPENTYVAPGPKWPQRQCKTCMRAHDVGRERNPNRPAPRHLASHQPDPAPGGTK